MKSFSAILLFLSGQELLVHINALPNYALAKPTAVKKRDDAANHTSHMRGNEC